MAPFDECSRMSPDTLEKSPTNLNIHIAAIANRGEDQTCILKEFFEKFIKQQEVMDEEIKQLRIEMSKLRKNINGGP